MKKKMIKNTDEALYKIVDFDKKVALAARRLLKSKKSLPALPLKTKQSKS
jgi:hypothetical protein